MAMANEAEARQGRIEDYGPPCRRCRERRWRIETRPKARLRRYLEIFFALPDVLIFQRESGGWPGTMAETWTCLNCGRTARR